MASVRKIAERVGVSIATVSRVLNNDPGVNPDTRDRVLLAANRWGYVPNVGRRSTTFVAFGYTGIRTLTSQFDAGVLDGVARGLDECRLDVAVVDLRRDKQPDETYTQFFMRKGIRGVILRTLAESRDVCVRIADEGFPHVVVSERFDESQVNYIDGESRTESVRAVEYLIALGHRRIAFAMHNAADRDHLDRLEGYREALSNHGLPYDERLVYRQPLTLAAGATVMKLMLTLADRPTAVYCADPALAVGVVQKAHELDLRVPEDLSIVGFDDSDVRYGVYPVLTAVCQNASRLGYQAAAWLGRAVQGDKTGPFRTTIPTYLEINRSTAPPGRGRVQIVMKDALIESNGAEPRGPTNGNGNGNGDGSGTMEKGLS
jgi:DNA-binding LacI/PurR family transcriptional regulator